MLHVLEFIGCWSVLSVPLGVFMGRHMKDEPSDAPYAADDMELPINRARASSPHDLRRIALLITAGVTQGDTGVDR